MDKEDFRIVVGALQLSVADMRKHLSMKIRRAATMHLMKVAEHTHNVVRVLPGLDWAERELVDKMDEICAAIDECVRVISSDTCDVADVEGVKLSLDKIISLIDAATGGGNRTQQTTDGAA